MTYDIDKQVLDNKAETKKFAGKMITDFNSDTVLGNSISTITNSLNQENLTEIQWQGQTLAALIPEKGQPLSVINAEMYEQAEPFWLASSSQSFPLRESVAAAHIVAETLETLIKAQRLTEVEGFISSISHRAYNDLCKFYKLSPAQTEVVFDDNATLVTYQFLGMLNLSSNPHIVSSLDIGHTMKLTLAGLKPEKLMYNFKPAVDLWRNSSIDHEAAKTVGPFQAHLINTFAEDGYQTDSNFLSEIKDLLEQFRPEVFIIPTVTSSGRKLPFIATCRAIRNNVKEIEGYNPIVILDDAQGGMRISRDEYTKADGVSTIWDYADAILMTGAKAMGALPGSSAMLINKPRFLAVEKVKTKNPLLYRARKYGFISNDEERLKEYNSVAPRLLNAPEITSLVTALQKMKLTNAVKEKVREANLYAHKRLRSIPEIAIVSASSDSSVVESIITFYIPRHPKDAKAFRDGLLQLSNKVRPNNLPITLPKLIETEQRDYLRIALEPARVIQSGYLDLLARALDRITRYAATFENSILATHEHTSDIMSEK
jgi:hypothetical protein